MSELRPLPATPGLHLSASRVGETETVWELHSQCWEMQPHRLPSTSLNPNEITSRELSAFRLLLVKLDKSDFGQAILHALLKVRLHGFSCPISWHSKRGQLFIVLGELQKQSIYHGALAECVQGQLCFLRAVDLGGQWWKLKGFDRPGAGVLFSQGARRPHSTAKSLHGSEPHFPGLEKEVNNGYYLPISWCRLDKNKCEKLAAWGIMHSRPP